MPTTIEEIYIHILHLLSPEDRLRLATLILNDLVESDKEIVHEDDTWTERDQIDLVNFSLQYSTSEYFDDEEMIE